MTKNKKKRQIKTFSREAVQFDIVHKMLECSGKLSSCLICIMLIGDADFFGAVECACYLIFYSISHSLKFIY